MPYFPLSERAGTLALTCTHILESESAVHFVLHHFDDGSWEFLCGENGHGAEHAVIVTIGELLTLDPSLHQLSDLPVGCCAKRASRDATWEIGRIPGEDWYPECESRMP